MAQHLSTLSPHPRLLVRWFVQYNPMFTASALCVLGGVLLLARALGSGADVALTGVLELYQLLVIGVAALLYRRLLERRPAAILGIIELVFLVDPTLQVSALATSHEVVATIAWVALFAIKWRALAWAFQLRLSRSVQVLPVLAAVLVAILPNAQLLMPDGAGRDALPIALAAAVFALGVVVILAPPTVESRTALGDVGRVMFPRIVRAAAFVGIGGVAYQSWNAMLQADSLALAPAIAAALFVVTAAQKNERALWASLAAALTASAFIGNGAIVLGLPLAAFALLIASRHHAPRVLTAAVLASAAAVVFPRLSHHRLLIHDSVAIVVVAVATVALVAIIARRRGWSAIPALLVLNFRPLTLAWTAFAPHGFGAWGGMLLVAGFVLLPAGVVLHRRLSRILALDDDALAAANEDGPSSSAAPMGAFAALSATIAVPRAEAG